MSARSFFLLLAAVSLAGCSLFHHDTAPATAQQLPAPAKKGFSLWPFGNKGPVDATPYLEYQRARVESDKTSYQLLARNTHVSKVIEGDIRTTLETGPNESKVTNEHFTLAPNETKKLLVYPEQAKLSYEVSAFFKE